MLIAGLTPSFLEKPFSWWKHNEHEIIRKRAVNPFWGRNTAILRKDELIKQSEFLRKLDELGYQKTPGIARKGTFKHLGSDIIVFAINKESPIIMEFTGNTVTDIHEHLLVEQEKTFPTKSDTALKFSAGDYIVHLDHGIGIFKEEKDGYLIINYAGPKNSGPDRLLVPLNQSSRVSAYLGLRTPPVHRLGTHLWQNTKKKAEEDIIKFAKYLSALYKKRSVVTRPPYFADEAEKEVWENFDFEETSDQKKALEEIFKDMSGARPSERVLAGDVGFGKTEVAMRAILRAILNGKQTALLCPTTVLADQHTELFRKRFEKLPVKVERLTRLESERKIKEIKRGLALGEIDLVIGTHKILQKNVDIKRLGLLVIDEEQKFGVKHKETLKEKYPDIDILYLSATPIPRTIAFCLAGIRPISQLKEAPRGRKAPLTYVLPFSEQIIKNALDFEKKRGGQSYYLANRIHYIPKILERLDKIVPELKKGVIHGRLHEKEIVKVMREFREGELDVLISTTIIENGLDISSVNTLITENSALLGLAQAHQLRGRIGRSYEQSYCYFLYPSGRLTPEGEKRLETLEEYSYLGAGFDIAKRDFEIRGAGNILGKEQSGVLNKIGWNLYFETLNLAIEEFED
ncbi:MAG: hypothetical protein COU46_00850 [Candidatus Niyogibacteria bacterium CG10_big_fil_rev_8_21_14_0_10_42_19]|uniref:Transcription-repair coupling factor n=1 Tax=Candidatus Niyogibacteria bacterium CG10_big_fil_rev_8_21_14_0_10_42_19 TaxID=1974725 RepID=A0A2H0TG90_9BACT|nr:MAG: hypothetical protein COU46_00850 [Candidatus Niyogibacteria bacterium CG10_big_fil_rev_8_21_14_0_10_42_19]